MEFYLSIFPNSWSDSRFQRLKADAGDRQERVYSVEKLAFGAEANFQFYRNAAENLRKTRRAVD